MPSVSYPFSAYQYRASPGNRAISWLVAIVSTVVLLIVLFEAGIVPALAPKPKTVSFQLLPEAKPAPPKSKPVQQKKTGGGAPKAPTPAPKPAAAAPKPTPPTPAPNWIPMTSAEMSQADISTKPSKSGGNQTASAGEGEGNGQGNASGDTIYDGDWYVRPPHTVLQTYLAHETHPGDWGEIACRTAERYQVTDCKQLDESLGSGISRAMLQAAWQFRILPPRINGHPIMGAWVRIRFTMEDHGDGG